MRISRPLALALASSLALTVVGCHKSSNDPVSSTETPQVTLSGTLTYTRIPVVTGTDGKLTGFQTDATQFTTMPLRGVVVRLYQNKTFQQPGPSGDVATKVWTLVGSTTTSDTGTYTFKADQGAEVFLEVVSADSYTTLGHEARVVAAQTTSTVQIKDRPIYSFRLAPQTTQPTTASKLPGGVVNDNTTIDYKFDLTTKWWLAPYNSVRVAEVDSIQQESAPSGSSPLAILDTLVDVANGVGDPTPAGILDLHYVKGVAEPQGTSANLDPESTLPTRPVSESHVYASISGSPTNDDAFDTGALVRLFGRMRAFAGSALHPIDRPITELSNLFPESALRHGFTEVYPAIFQKSPYLCDIRSGSVLVRDIRDTAGAPKDMNSPAAIAALTWDLALRAASITAPGTPTNWSTITYAHISRWMALTAPVDTDGNTVDIISLYGQLAKLANTRADGEPVDLKAIFTDDVIKTMLTGWNMTWPRPTTGDLSTFMPDWGTDAVLRPTATVAGKTLTRPLTLDMANAPASANGTYTNQGAGERIFGRMALTLDTPVQIVLSNPIPAGAQVEFTFQHFVGTTLMTRKMVLDANTPSDPNDITRRIVLAGKTGTETTTKTTYIIVRLISPSNIGTYTANLQLIPSLQ